MGWKSQKDREAFIAELREAGVDQATIDADVKAIDEEKSAPVAVPPPALKPSSQAGGGGSPMTQPETAAPSMAAAPAQSVQADLSSMTQARQDQGNSLTDQVFNLENAQLLGIPLAVYGGYKLADKALEKSGLKARMFGQSAPIDRTVDVPMETVPDNKLPQAAQQKFSPKEAIIEAEINKKFPFTFQEAKKGLGLEGVTVVDPMQAQAVAKQYSNQLQAQASTIQPPVVSQAPVGIAPPVVSEPVSVVATEVVEEKKKPVKPPAKAPKAKMDMPEGWGKGMTWLTSGYGVEGAQAFINQYNEGKPFQSHDEMNKVYQSVMTKPKYSDIPKDVRKERGIIQRAALPVLPMAAVPPSLQASPQLGGGGGGGNLIRGLTDPLQLKQ